MALNRESQKQPRRRKCVCGDWFRPYNTLQKVCSTTCAIALVKIENEIKAKKAQREAKQRIKRRGEWVAEAQQAFNLFIRLRDRHQPCISCGRLDGQIDDPLRGGKWDAGHFKSVGAFPELRFEESNCHKQCKSCNGGSGKYARKDRTVSTEYRERLVARIGLEAVEWLEGPHSPKRYSIEELKAIKADYRARAKKLRV